MACLKPSMFVMGAIFDNSFIIQNLYELLPIVPIFGYNHIKGTIPYFGIDCAIVSVVPSISTNNGFIYKSRGVRKGNSTQGSFGNSIAIDFQTLGKGFHIKLSSSKKIKSKFHITGIKNPEMAVKVTESLLKQIELTEKAWLPFFKMDYMSKYHFLTSMIEMVKNGDNILPEFNEIVQKRLELKRIELGELYDTAKLILRYTYEDFTLCDFCGRMLRILILNPGVYSIFHNEDKFKINTYDIYNGAYNGKIGYVNLYVEFIVRKLLDMGFQCGFFNIGKQEFRILVPIVSNHHYTDDLKKVNNKGHLFKINLDGSLDLYSRGDFNEVMIIGMYVINKIREIMETSEYINSTGGTLIQYQDEINPVNENQEI